MAQHRYFAPNAAPLDFDALRAELEVPGPFPAAVLAEADDVATATHRGRRDATDLELVTIDPPGSTDLDQAVGLTQKGRGWRVHYAIADVAAWVPPDGAIDTEAQQRTQTFYAPDRRDPLHPPVLGEGAASLLPDGPRPAVLWTIDVDADGATTDIEVGRAQVRSRAQLTYQQVQDDLAGDQAPACLEPFPELGEALLAAARRRGAIDLGLPEQDVVAGPEGGWELRLRSDLPVEQWNAQISLLTGRAAASLMLDGGFGLLRTLPAPDPASFPRLRTAALSLQIPWPADRHPGEVLAGLDTSRPHHAAFADLAAELLRGAAYTPFDGEPPADPGHGGVGAPYAHVTAPLRRLVDRYGTEICLSLSGGDDVPDWVHRALPDLPGRMHEGSARARRFERAVIDATEALVLADHVGATFGAYVLETGDRHGTVVLDEPPVQARCDTRDLPLGLEVRVRCTEADVATRTVRFERVS